MSRFPKYDYSKKPLFNEVTGRRRRLSQDEIQKLCRLARNVDLSNKYSIGILRHNIKVNFGFYPSNRWVADVVRKFLYGWRDEKLNLRCKRTYKNNKLADYLSDLIIIVLDPEWGKSKKSFESAVKCLIPEVRYYDGLYYRIKSEARKFR